MNLRKIYTSRLLAIACLIFLLIVMTACGGAGGGNAETVPEPLASSCDLTSFLDDGVCRSFATRIDERVPTPFLEDGQPVGLEIVLFKPLEEGRFPTIMFNHGSTGNGSDPSKFGLTFASKAIIRFFVERGWMVAFPQRRGRGLSDGLYDEGFKPDRSSYSCAEDLALGGAERALEDLDVTTDWLRNRADVDTTRMLVGGSSRGGILSVAYVARRPEVYFGAINFVGGWLGEGCGDFRSVNRALFVSGARFPGPSLWLYGTNDSFYSVSYSRTNFDSFSVAGGYGTFHEFTRAPGLNGHNLINDHALWSDAMDQFLEQW